MNDSKFCEHGVNVGLENPPVFCGQCPPDTIATLRADLATEQRSRYASDEDAARLRAQLETLRADLARVSNTAYELIARHTTPRDAELASLRAELARVTAERDARPAITREDARIYRHATGEGASALWRVERALEAHAKGGER